MMTKRHGRPGERGFSFIEVLVVMGIISVLVGGIIFAIGVWAEKQPEFYTKNTINKVKMLIENFHSQFEVYPPSDVTRIATVTGQGNNPSAPTNNINAMIESLYQALAWPGYKGDPQWGENELRNRDDDALRKAVNKLNTADLWEIVDGYENPLVYFHNEDYKRYEDGGAEYLSRDKDGIELDVAPVPYRNEDGTFRNPDSFQIWSMGPDGIPNNDDDITPWGG